MSLIDVEEINEVTLEYFIPTSARRRSPIKRRVFATNEFGTHFSTKNLDRAKREGIIDEIDLSLTAAGNALHPAP